LFLGAVVVGESTLPEPDPRVQRLTAFFDRYECPAPHYAEEYVRAADEYEIDYRLLPAISVVESTCGAYSRLNNHWGWNNANTGFHSVLRGIRYISHQLAEGRHYKDKSLDGKLWAYNPRPAYARKVKALMRQVDRF
jgi:hypothetical protein